jgi:uncharacterized membrane protein YgdD (TMEM256/DUF423 family)
MLNEKRLMAIGLLGATAVAFGAMGAHYLKSKIEGGGITLDQVNGFDTGVKYQIYHTLAMLFLVLHYKEHPNKYLDWAYLFFFFGIIMFSGSLYLLCTRNLLGADWLTVLGPVTPLGGVCFIIGWLLISFSVLKKGKNTPL